ncbi:enhancer of split m7 protein [Musca vetustissima]|uniref:enhancer of split m7 protein n=1 Tax=Musca vetustissima TaxID=27455 RepID=UPI002AB794F8|nr:enhancer of split m7 protein [Musca vetustissima]
MASKYEMSKTYQYRKVMKPLLERKRRARINKCLDDLKDLMAECFKQEGGDSTQKFEKADILEVTVEHLRKLKAQKQQINQNNLSAQQSFRSGYIQAANEVSRCMATLPNIDVGFGTKLMTHLGLRLSQLESPQEQPLAVSTPLTVACASSQSTAASAMYSPVSSGYASDCDSSSSSASSSSRSPVLTQHKQGLLQVSTNAPVWRPW